jgi:hypothetical protein
MSVDRMTTWIMALMSLRKGTFWAIGVTSVSIKIAAGIDYSV